MTKLMSAIALTLEKTGDLQKVRSQPIADILTCVGGNKLTASQYSVSINLGKLRNARARENFQNKLITTALVLALGAISALVSQ